LLSHSQLCGREEELIVVGGGNSAGQAEILGIKVRDIHFNVTINGKQYAEVIINGKTGNRAVPLIDSIPYLKDWLDSHPQPGNSYRIETVQRLGRSWNITQ
jgi:hypothetical protein